MKLAARRSTSNRVDLTIREKHDITLEQRLVFEKDSEWVSVVCNIF